MNKTISINLGGSIFNIEEDAYLVLKSYLDRIKSNFATDTSVEEIMSDIEGRIAELFSSKLQAPKIVIDKKDVEEIMIVMGRPEDFAPENSAQSHSQQTGSNANEGTPKHDRRRIYRDTDDAYVGGVCSGLSYYLGWDPIILRIGFVLLVIFGGSGIPAYIILWAVIPAASNTAEKLRMRGEPVTIDNISKFVNEEAKNASDRVRGFEERMKSKMQNRPNAVGSIFRRVFGALFVMFALFLLIAFVTGSVFTFNGGPASNLTMIDELVFQNDGNLWWLIIGGHLVVLMPIFAILYIGFRLLVENSKRVKGLPWIFLTLFIIGILITVVGSATLIREFSRDNEVMQTLTIDSIADSTFAIDVKNDTVFLGRSTNDERYPFDWHSKIGDKNYYGNDIYFSIKTISTLDTPKLVIERRASGKTLSEAGERAEKIDYAYSLNGNKLTLDPYFTTPSNEPYRNQSVKILLYLPNGTRIEMNDNMHLISDYWSEKGNATVLENEY